MAARVRRALRITADPGAMDAYRGFVDAFLLPRYEMIDRAVGFGIMGGIDATILPMLAGRGSAEVDPAAFLQALLDQGDIR